ncbi:MAG: hypothetical protein JW774_05850 [Candidatus Aureabacteria bacterium]|nr:hypothetical protein [Candidatus Auribacterota bacterium]
MKRSIYTVFLSGILMLFSETWLHSAIFQEPLPQDTKTLKTHYLFIKDNFPQPLPKPAAPLETPQLPQEPAVKTPVPSSASPFHITSVYIRPTLGSVTQLFRKYKDIPGGITLEGTAAGLDEINEVLYDPQKNIFVLNRKWIYENPLSHAETKALFLAMDQDDLAGVSLGDTDATYGALEEGSIPCINLKMADHFLGCIVFSNQSWVKQHTFPGGYRPKNNSESGRGYYSAYFNFRDYVFKKENDKVKLEEARMIATLIPLTKSNSRYLPDSRKIVKEMIPEAYESNIRHITSEISSYSTDSRLQKVFAYGEMASFARTLKEKGLSLSGIIG